MNERTGRNRRWIQSRNPSLEALEARLVLAQAATSSLEHLLAPVEQHDRPASTGVTIDSAARMVKPKADLPFISPKDLGEIAGSPPQSPHYLSHGSLSEPQAAVTQQPISLGIEASVAGLAPFSATEAKSVGLTLAALLDPTLGKGVKLTHPPDRPASAPDRPASAPDRPASAPDRPASAPDRPASAPDRPASAPDRPAPAPDRPAPAPDRPAPAPDRPAAPEPPNSNAELAQASAEAESVRAATPTAPPPSVEAQSKQGTAPLAGQDPSIVVGSGRMIDGYTVQERIHDSQGLLDADFASMPIEQTKEGGVLSPIVRLALRTEEDGESPPAPLSGDLILDFLPYNVTALRTALEGFLAESEQVLLSNVSREGVAVGLFTAALVTSGMAGYAAWECLRGSGERPGSFDWLEGEGLTRHNLALGLQFPELT